MDNVDKLDQFRLWLWLWFHFQQWPQDYLSIWWSCLQMARDHLLFGFFSWPKKKIFQLFLFYMVNYFTELEKKSMQSDPLEMDQSLLFIRSRAADYHCHMNIIIIIINILGYFVFFCFVRYFLFFVRPGNWKKIKR